MKIQKLSQDRVYVVDLDTFAQPRRFVRAKFFLHYLAAVFIRSSSA
jgi:hypothetical protein